MIRKLPPAMSTHVKKHLHTLICLSESVWKTTTMLTLVVILLMPVQLEAKPEAFTYSPSDELPVNITAEAMNYYHEHELFTARGSVEMVQGSRILKADFLKVNLITKDAEAKGNVQLFEDEDVLQCNAFTINLDTQTGVVRNAKLFIKKENFHIKGKEVKKLGLDTYQINNGVITTCDGQNPLWRIDAKNIDITIDGYAKVRNSVIHIKNIPVAYFPYFIVPVKTTRQSGFLFPQIGFSRREGFQFNTSFFWAISPSSDATFFLDTATKKGIGEGIEYRFVLNEDSWGKFYGYFTKEENWYFNHEYHNIRDRDQERAVVNFEGIHYFSPDFYIKAFANYITDREFYKDYGTQMRRTKSSMERGGLRSLEKDESFVFATKNWEFYSLLVNFNLYKNLVKRDDSTLQKTPQIVFSSIRQPLWKTPFYYQWSSSYNYFWREKGLKGHRIDIYPKLSLPLNRGGWLKFHPEIGLRAIANFGLNDNKELHKSRVFPDIRAELSTTFLRIFTFTGKKVQKLKHTIEPRLEYEYVPDIDQEDFPSFDMPEDFFKRHSLTYSVTNRFTALFKDFTDQVSEREIGYLKLGQTFNMRHPKGGLYLGGDREDDLSDLFAEIRVTILPALYIKTKAGYDPNNNDLSFYNALLLWENREGEYLQLQYRYERKKLEVLDMRGKMKLSPSISAYFKSRYDAFDNRSLDNELGIDYAAQCWGAKLFYETRASTGGRRRDDRFEAVIYLKGLGEVGKLK